MRGLGFLIAGGELGMAFEAFLRAHNAGSTPREAIVNIVLGGAVIVVLLCSRPRAIGLD